MSSVTVSSAPSHMEAHGRVLRIPSTALAAPKHNSRLRRYGLPALAVLLAIFTGVGAVLWSLSGKSTTQYVTVPISRGAVTRAVTATGTVNPELTVIVGTYVSGVIQQLFCDYNTEVKAGQICAKIDPRPYQATLDQYMGQLLRDQAILTKDRANLARYQRLAAENSIARQQAEDQAYVVQQDEGTVKLDQGLVESAKFNLGYTDIVSPVDGTVVSRNVTQGQTVAASFQTPTLFLIASDLKKMQVDTNVSESDIGGIKEGDEGIFTVDAYPKRTFQGKVSEVRQSPQTVQNVVTYDVVISIDNSELTLKPGMTAAARIIVDQRSDVLRVPNQALRYRPKSVAETRQPAVAPETASFGEANQARIWILRDSEPKAVPVIVGLDDDSYTEIKSGDVQAGDQVIIAEQGAASGHAAMPVPRL